MCITLINNKIRLARMQYERIFSSWKKYVKIKFICRNYAFKVEKELSMNNLLKAVIKKIQDVIRVRL